jgi:hypothetical protein
MEAGIGHRMVFASTFVSVISCLLGLAFFGAYNKLWRYFNRKDYLHHVRTDNRYGLGRKFCATE